MEVLLYGQKFNVIVEKKNNKNMYLRVKKDGIHITCNYFVTKSMILSFINKNKDSIIKMNEVVSQVFVKNKTYLKTFLSNEAQRIFNDRVNICYNLFEEDIPYPNVLIGKMKRKWGYCNKREKLIKLNSELIKYSINEIDYVIVHELSHFIEFNHSKNFWKYVKKYYPNYKEAQKVLKEE